MNDQLALIIEDTADLADIFSYALQEAGFRTEAVKDGEKALARLDDGSRESPSVVVLDRHLPQVDGVSILRHIRADERLASTQVIVVTSDPRMAETIQDRADIVLIKPVSFDQLRVLSARLATNHST